MRLDGYQGRHVLRRFTGKGENATRAFSGSAGTWNRTLRGGSEERIPMKVTRIVPALLLVASLMVVVLSAQFVHSNPVSAQTSTGTTTAVVTSPTGTTTAVVSPSPSPTTPPVLAA